MRGALQDFRCALRQLRKSPGFILFAVLITTLGIGTTVAMFSVIRAVLLKPLGYRQPEQLMLVTGSATPIRFDEMKTAARSYSELAAYADVPENMPLSGVVEPEVLKGARVSANFLDLLGTSPLRGRSFLPEEDKPGAGGVALISAQLWQRRFAGDPKTVGQTVTLAGSPHAVVGILPPGFQFPFSGLDVWVAKPTELAMISPDSRPFSPTLVVVGRLKASVTIRQAEAELKVLNRQYAAAHPAMLDAKPNPSTQIVPLKEDLISDVRPKLWMLFGAVGLVLLIVCANLGSLLLARATSRTREFAIRAAIGAGRGRILRQLVSESILLAVGGGALGVTLAALSLTILRSTTFIDLPRAGAIHIDNMVLGFAVLLSIGTGVLFGLVPALAVSRPNLISVLRGNQETETPTGSKAMVPFGLRGTLVVGQVMLSITLLIGAALLIESLAHLYRADPGFQPAHLLTMRIALPPARYDTAEKRAEFFGNLVERVESLHGVRTAAVTFTLPMTGWSGTPVQLAKGPLLKLNQRPIGIIQFISPDYFRTLGIAVRRGRAFTDHDDLHSTPVVVIDESLARRFWPEYPNGPDPIGQQMLVGRGPHPREIVGVVTNVRQSGKNQDLRPEFYCPAAQTPPQSVMLAVKTDRDPLSLTNAIRSQVFSVDPAQPVSDVKTMGDIVEESEGQVRLMMRLLTAFAGTAIFLAVLGLYGMISYSVIQRAKEIGIRQALGAQRTDILSLVIRQAVGISLVGVLLGLGMATALTRLLKDLLFQVRPTDPATFVAVSVLFFLVALAASYIPARRAAKVDPMVALRYE
jgi:putative ABC transport system permease protein